MHKDDSQLTQFLRTYHPTPPPPHPDLEDRLMAKLPARPLIGWGIIALGGVAIATIAVSLTRPQPQIVLTEQERKEIVAYLLDGWNYEATGGNDEQSF